MMPIAEKPTEDKTIHAIRAPMLVIRVSKKAMPMRLGMTEIPIPKMTPARVLPKRIAWRETGEVRNLSKVWLARSLGMTTGPMDDEAKKRV